MKRKLVYANLIYTAIFILLIALDRITKQFAIDYVMKQEIDIIPNIFTLHYLENRGAAFVVRYAYITVYHVRLSVIFQMRTLVAIYVIGFVAALHYIICLIINTQR